MYNYNQILDKYLLTKRGVLPTGMMAVMNALYPNEVRDIMTLKCPFCGRRFGRRANLASHLYRSECSFAYRSMVMNIVRAYKMIRYIIRNDGHDKIYVVLDNNETRFNNLYDAYTYAVNYLLKKGRI